MSVTYPPRPTPRAPGLQLYCPNDRRVTRHERVGPSQALVCIECGRRVDEAGGVQVPRDEALSLPRVSVGYPRPTRPARPRRSWIPIGLGLAAILGTSIAIATLVRSVAAPTPESAHAPTSRTVDAAPPAVVAPLVDVSSVRIANTDGEGAYIRRTPNLEDRLRAWPDGTTLKVTGADTTANGMKWKPVEDPAGNRGWIPSQYTAP